VAQACERYVDHLRDEKGDKSADDAKARFARYVLPNKRLSGTEITKLTPRTLGRLAQGAAGHGHGQAGRVKARNDPMPR
jgi:hypothetical protein